MGDLKPRSGGDLVPTPKQVGLDPQMRPARQPPPIRHKKMNHDAIAMARFFSGLLTLFSIFLFATLIGGLDWPFGCTRKSIATVMNITIWLFGAIEREFVLQPNAAFLAFSFKQILTTKSHPFHLEMIRCLESQSAARGHHRMSAH
jgi:hypothetical protein